VSLDIDLFDLRLFVIFQSYKSVRKNFEKFEKVVENGLIIDMGQLTFQRKRKEIFLIFYFTIKPFIWEFLYIFFPYIFKLVGIETKSI
jgi:hypothetical protein